MISIQRSTSHLLAKTVRKPRRRGNEKQLSVKYPSFNDPVEQLVSNYNFKDAPTRTTTFASPRTPWMNDPKIISAKETLVPTEYFS